MGRLFLIDFEKRPTIVGVGPYYICRTCQTHIALVEERVGESVFHTEPKIYFNKVINVFKDGPEHRQGGVIADTIIANVYCVKCTMLLGSKCISTADQPNLFFYKYMLRRDKLLLKRNGQLLNPANLEPFEEPHPNA